MSSPESLNSRLAFMSLDEGVQDSLRAVKQVVMSALPAALDQFYALVASVPETGRFFSSQGQMEGAKARQVSHWERISSGRFDATYVEAVTRVGEVHARIGLEPRWYIGGYAVLLDAPLGAVVEARWPSGGLFSKKGPAAGQVAAELGGLAKATLLDMDYAISVYLEAAEAARVRAEAEVLAREREQVVATVGRAMAELARGNFTFRMPDDLPGEYAALRDDFNAALATLHDTMVAIAGATGAVSGGADEISGAADDLSRRTEQQAASLEQTAAALDQITATVRRSADGARKVNDVAVAARTDAARSGEVMTDAVAAMGEIEQSSRQIAQIIGVIDEIAFQTNLLALNAGVEAARAGDAGRGFAVVAQEVRALAQRSAEAAREIKTLIASSTGQVERGVKLVGDTGHALTGIVARVTEIGGLIAEIALSSQEQATALAQVNTAVNQMDQVTQQNAAMVEQATAAAASLKSEAHELTRRIGRFQLGSAGNVGTSRVRTSRPADRAVEPNTVHSARARIAASVGGQRAAPSVDDGWEEF